MKLYFAGFWQEFDIKNNCLTKFLNKYEIINDEEKADIILYSYFLIPKFYENKISVLVITEPIQLNKKLYDLYVNNKFNYVIGCINDNISINYYKFPLYLMYYNYLDKNIYSNINNYVKNININSKKFCILINRHDKGNTRTKIFNALNKINFVNSYGKLLNNSDNTLLNKIGKEEYMKNYIFNICPENFRCPFNGYITEKLLHACLSGCIPIYYGYLVFYKTK